MAKSSQAVLAIAFCLFSLLGFAYCDEVLSVQGKVFCDTCRTGFETSATEYIEGAQVRLECKDREGGHLTYSHDDVTDASGTYKIPVEGEHEEEICEVILVKSPRADCAETLNGRDRARVLITANNGITDTTRWANSLGFLKSVVLPNCADILKELGILPSAMIPVEPKH